MLKVIMLAMIIGTVFSMGSDRSVKASSLGISRFQWKNRLLFLFAPNRDHPFFDDLHKQLAVRKAEVDNRDLVIFEILESGPSGINMDDLDPRSVRPLQEKFDIHPGEFVVILIGKDGGIKLDHRDQIQLDDILGLIDSMPMRREEMRQKSQNP